MADVPGNEIDAYLDALEEPKRSTLTRLPTRSWVIPDAEQGISYGMPAFRLRGNTVAGFAAFKNHLSYLPHFGSVIPNSARSWRATHPPVARCTSPSTSEPTVCPSDGSGKTGRSRSLPSTIRVSFQAGFDGYRATGYPGRLTMPAGVSESARRCLSLSAEA